MLHTKSKVTPCLTEYDLRIDTMGKRATKIDNIALKRRIDLSLTYTNIVTFAAVSVFLPYVLTAIVLTFLAVYIIANKYTRQLIFVHEGSFLLKIFFGYILILPVIYHNWMGLFVGVGIIMASVIGLFMRSVMTRELYERTLHMVCALSLTSTGYALIEFILNLILDGRHSHRIASVFSHPNYFGTMTGMILIICAYKLLTGQESKLFYTVVGTANVISMYLCKSMFVWIEVFVGVTVLLIVFKKFRLLAVWLTAAAAGAACIFLLNLNLIPRLSDADDTLNIRLQIWELAVRQIKESPWFGHGFMSFSYVYHAAYHGNLIPHSHSIYLDMLLNFGIVGTVLFLLFLGRYYLTLLKSRFEDKNIVITGLILAVTAAALVHGTTDLTLLWIQTFPLFLLIASGLGADEKNGRYHINTDCFF